MNLQKAILLASMLFSTTVFAGGPNSNIKYYGYDWLDGDQNYTAVDALSAISSKGAGFSRTNLNVVHNIANLNSSVCSLNSCVVSITAGDGHCSASNDDPVACQSTATYGNWLDICPGALTDSQCRERGSWGRIWNIAFSLASAKNRPLAIYFIDEPFDKYALRRDGKYGPYEPYQYASYLCTLRQAMKAYGLNVPVYTVLSQLQAETQAFVSEIQLGAPITGCPAADKSTPDWIGIDNYNSDPEKMWRTYEKVAPSTNPNSPKWVLVPPATKKWIDQGKEDFSIHTDDQIHAQIQSHWDFLNQHPTAPVIYIMNWRFDPDVTLNRATYPFPKANALLSFMGNTITP